MRLISFTWQCRTVPHRYCFDHIARDDHHRAHAAAIWQVPLDWKQPKGTLATPGSVQLRQTWALWTSATRWPGKGHYSRWVATYCGHSNAPMEYAIKERKEETTQILPSNHWARLTPTVSIIIITFMSTNPLDYKGI